MINKIVNGELIPLTEEEIQEYEQRIVQHEAEISAYALVKYKDDRRFAYEQQGASIQNIVEALREYLMESRPEKLQSIQSIVEQIKVEFPKPMGT